MHSLAPPPGDSSSPTGSKHSQDKDCTDPMRANPLQVIVRTDDMPASAHRMKLLVNPFEAGVIDVRVDLGRGNAGMAE